MFNGAFAICYTELIGVNLVYGIMAQLKMCMMNMYSTFSKLKAQLTSLSASHSHAGFSRPEEYLSWNSQLAATATRLSTAIQARGRHNDNGQSKDDCIQISKHQPALQAFLETKQDMIKDIIGEGTKVLILEDLCGHCGISAALGFTASWIKLCYEDPFLGSWNYCPRYRHITIPSWHLKAFAIGMSSARWSTMRNSLVNIMTTQELSKESIVWVEDFV